METLQQQLEEIKALILGQQKEIYNAEQASDFLTISYDSLLRHARSGFIRSAKNGNHYIFKKEWLLDWIEQGGTK